MSRDPDAEIQTASDDSSAASPRPIRIAFCHYTSDVCGGSDRSLFDLVTHLDPSAFQTFLLLRRGDPLAPAYREAGCTVAEIPFVAPRRALEWGKLFRFFFWFWPHVVYAAWLFRRWNVDMVHVNTLNNLQGPFGATLSRKPLIWHVRELVPDSRADRLMRGLVARLATRAVANSPAVAATLSGVGPRLHTILNGIDLSEYPETTPADLSRFQGEPLVLCIGRQEPWKGQHVLVEALPAVLKAHPMARVWFVGGPAVNKPDYAPALVTRCAELGISDRVNFTGIRTDIPELLGQAAVLVLPSVTAEPFGRTLVEGMAAGCAVVATAAGGPLDIVVDGETGLLVGQDKPEALSTALITLLDDPERAQRLGIQGYARAHRHFSLTRLVAEMATLFTDVYTNAPPRNT